MLFESDAIGNVSSHSYYTKKRKFQVEQRISNNFYDIVRKSRHDKLGHFVHSYEEFVWSHKSSSAWKSIFNERVEV